MTQAFISYSRKDKPFVQRLHTHLAGLGRNIWVDWEDIPPSSDWWQRIERGIDDATAFIFVITPNSVGSEYCNKELTYALNANKRFIPLCYVEVTDPADKARMHPALSKIDWVQMRDGMDDFEAAIKELLQAIDTDLIYVEEHARLWERAREWNDKKRNRSFLLSGDDLNAAQHWLENAAALNKTPVPTALHREYILAGRAAEHDRQRRLLAAAAVAVVVSLALAVLAMIQANRAETQRQIAVTAQENAELNAQTAVAAENTAIFNADRASSEEAAALRNANIAATNETIANRRSDEARSLALSAKAAEARQRNQIEALALAMQAVAIPDPPQQAQNLLTRLVYEPGPRQIWVERGPEILSLAFSPEGDRTITAMSDSTLVLWDVNTGTPIRTLRGHTDKVNSVAFRPGGGFVLSGSADGTVREWDLETGETSWELIGHQGAVSSVAYNADGSYGLSGSDDGTLILWNLWLGSAQNTFAGHESPITSLAISPDNTRAISGDAKGVAIIWDTKEDRELYRVQASIDENRLLTVGFSPDSREFLTSDSASINLWDVATGTWKLGYNDHTDEVNSLSYDTALGAVVSTGKDRTIRLWVPTLNGTVVNLLRLAGHADWVNTVQATPDGMHLLSGGRDGSLIYWDIFPGNLEKDLFIEGVGSFLHVSVSTDSQHILASYSDGSMILWDRQSYEPIQTFKAEDGEGGAAIGSALSADGRYALAANEDGLLRLFSVESGDLIRAFQGHAGAARSVAFSPNGQRLISGGNDDMVMVWDVETGQVAHWLFGHSNSVQSVAFSPDGRYAASGGADNRVFLWDTERGRIARALDGHTDYVDSVAFNADGTLLASASEDNSIILWDVITGQQIKRLLGHTNWVRSVAFNPDSQSLVSSSRDGTLILWDLQSGEPINQFFAFGIDILGTAFAPDGSWITSGFGTSLVIWDLTTLDEAIAWARQNRPIRDLTCAERQQFNLPLDAACG